MSCGRRPNTCDPAASDPSSTPQLPRRVGDHSRCGQSGRPSAAPELPLGRATCGRKLTGRPGLGTPPSSGKIPSMILSTRRCAPSTRSRRFARPPSLRRGRFCVRSVRANAQSGALLSLQRRSGAHAPKTKPAGNSPRPRTELPLCARLIGHSVTDARPSERFVSLPVLRVDRLRRGAWAPTTSARCAGGRTTSHSFGFRPRAARTAPRSLMLRGWPFQGSRKTDPDSTRRAWAIALNHDGVHLTQRST
jgi:hypothetical protein